MAGIYKGNIKVADLLPEISVDTNGKFLTNDGTDTFWEEIDLSSKQDILVAGNNIQIAADGKTISATDTTYTAGTGLTLSGTTFSANITDNVTSTSTTSSLSAKQGKELSDRITNLESLGRYLSEWDCATGLAMTNPPYDNYPYRTGDYFLVLNVASAGGTNYRPSGDEYVIGQPSTTVETGSVSVGSRYIYDGTVWILQGSAGVTASFANLGGSPYDNSNLANALNEKANTDDLATVATTGNYNDLSNKPTIPAAQVPADWNATSGVSRILNKPTIPTVPTNISAFTNDSNYQTGTKVSSAISTHNSSSSAHSDIRSAVASKSTVSVSATGTATDEVKYITIDGVQKKLAGGSGSGHNVGDIFQTKRTDTALAGAVECNGATYSTTDYSGSGAIGALLTAGKIDYISLTDYATAISTKGWCDSIGWNGTGTTAFRVPTLTPHIVQKNNIPVVGNGTTLGLTDGTKNGTLFTAGSGSNLIREGAYGKPTGTTTMGSGIQNNASIGVTTDGTKSGIIADLTDVATTERVMIQLFNGATDEAVATVGTVVAQVGALNTRTDGMIDYVVEFQRPTASNNYTWYRLYKSGWVEQGGRTMTGRQTITFPIPFNDVPTMTWGFCTQRSGASYDGEIYFRDITATNFISGSRMTDARSPGFMWRAEGIAA